MHMCSCWCNLLEIVAIINLANRLIGSSLVVLTWIELDGLVMIGSFPAIGVAAVSWELCISPSSSTMVETKMLCVSSSTFDWLPLPSAIWNRTGTKANGRRCWSVELPGLMLCMKPWRCRLKRIRLSMGKMGPAGEEAGPWFTVRYTTTGTKSCPFTENVKLFLTFDSSNVVISSGIASAGFSISADVFGSTRKKFSNNDHHGWAAAEAAERKVNCNSKKKKSAHWIEIGISWENRKAFSSARAYRASDRADSITRRGSPLRRRSKTQQNLNLLFAHF